MAKTAAERVRDHRQRQVDLIASLRAQVTEINARLAALDREAVVLRRENENLRDMLDQSEAANHEAPGAGSAGRDWLEDIA